MSFMVNGEMYCDDEDRVNQDDFMPHSWKQGNEFEQQEEEEDDNLGYEDPNEYELKAESVPVMPGEFYDKVDKLLSKPSPVLTGCKPSTIEKLPNIIKSKSVNSVSIPINPKSNKVRSKIEGSINYSQRPIDRNLLQEAMQYVDKLAQQPDNDDDDQQLDMEPSGNISNSNSKVSAKGNKNKIISPDKATGGKPKISPYVSSNSGNRVNMHMPEPPVFGGIASGMNLYTNEYQPQQQQPFQPAHMQQQIESNDDLYLQLRNHSKPNNSNGNGNVGNQGPIVIKKSHPYLSNPANNSTKKSKKIKDKSGGNNSGGGNMVSKLRDDVDNNQAAFSNLNTNYSSSMGMGMDGTHDSSSATDMNAMIENFTKGLTYHKLKEELEHSKKSLEKSNQFMQQLARDVKMYK